MAENAAPLRVAMVGVHRSLGRTLAHHNWATAFDAVPETSMAAVFDLGAETRDEFLACWGSEIPAYDDYQRMLAEVQPDLVCIATSQSMHADQIEQAVAAGVRGILCDKPLATSLDEMDRIVAACKEQGRAVGLRPRPTLDAGLSLPAAACWRTGAIGDVTSVLAIWLAEPHQPRLPLVRRDARAGRRPGANVGERRSRWTYRASRPTRARTWTRPGTAEWAYPTVCSAT